MEDLAKLKLSEIRDGLRDGDFTAHEVTESCLKRIEQHNKSLNAFVEVTTERAMKQADIADKKIKSGEADAMTGITIGVKDLFCTENIKTTAASKILTDFKPPYESHITEKLWQSGSVMLGKLNMDEFAMGSANSNSNYGNVINPWKAEASDKDLVPGGSSGGSAAAVAANLCHMALGTDTGGSIRQPASFCGIVGVKPSYGRCSRFGIIAFASSLDQAGVLTRSVKDAAISLQAIMGHDKRDSTSSNKEIPDLEKALDGSIKGMKIGIPEEYKVDGMDEQIIAIWEKGEKMLQDAGAEIIPIKLPHTKYALPAYYIIAPAEASSNLARYDGVRYGLRVEGKDINDMYRKTRSAGFGQEVKRRIMIGSHVLSSGYYDAYYRKAQKIRSLIIQDFSNNFEKLDAILTPTTPSAAFGVGEKDTDPIAMYLNDALTVPSSLAGLPAISLPAGLNDQKLPLGLQLICKNFDEENLFKIAHVLEDQLNFEFSPNGF